MSSGMRSVKSNFHTVTFVITFPMAPPGPLSVNLDPGSVFASDTKRTEEPSGATMAFV